MKVKAPEVSPEEAFAQSTAGEAVIVDVREQREWEAGHIPGALHMPLGKLGARSERHRRAGTAEGRD